MKRSTLEHYFEISMLPLFDPEFNAPKREFMFVKGRRWRFDYAWPEQRVAVELEGGIWGNGRHTRGSGFLEDCNKYNTAVLNGWRVLRFTINHLEDDPIQVVNIIQELLQNGRQSTPTHDVPTGSARKNRTRKKPLP